MGLAAANRLKYRRDFSAVYQHGIRRSTSHLTLRALRPSIESSTAIYPPSKFGISISQKVSKLATVRNRIKRQLRAVIHQLLPLVLPGWRFVIVVRVGADQCDYVKFLQELKQLLEDAEVLHGHS